MRFCRRYDLAKSNLVHAVASGWWAVQQNMAGRPYSKSLKIPCCAWDANESEVTLTCNLVCKVNKRAPSAFLSASVNLSAPSRLIDTRLFIKLSRDWMTSIYEAVSVWKSLKLWTASLIWVKDCWVSPEVPKERLSNPKPVSEKSFPTTFNAEEFSELNEWPAPYNPVQI